MLYIILTISISVSLLILFKYFDKYNIDSFFAIAINYLAATLTGIIVSGNSIDNNSIIQINWLPYTIPLGLLFILVFYGISKTTQLIGISIAALANKMSLAMPVLFSILFLNQKVSIINTTGIILALLAVYLTIKKDSKTQTKFSYYLLPILVFFGSGLIDIGINYANSTIITNPNESSIFTFNIFMMAFAFGLIALVIKFVKQKNELNKNKLRYFGKHMLAGFALGIPNYFSIYFIFKALESNIMQSALLFPVLNISNVLLSAIVGFTVFKEKLSVINYIGLLLSIVSIILISL